MNLEQALEIVSTDVFERFHRRLNDVETITLSGAWQGQIYEQIAESAGYSIAYIMRHVGVWLV